MNRLVERQWFVRVRRMRRTDPVSKLALRVVPDLLREELASVSVIPLTLWRVDTIYAHLSVALGPPRGAGQVRS